MTAPAKHRYEVDVMKPREETRQPVSITMTNEIAAQRLIGLLSELVAQGALPVL